MIPFFVTLIPCIVFQPLLPHSQSTSWRLSGAVLPQKQLIRLEPHFFDKNGSTDGYTVLQVVVKSPTDRITLHVNHKGLNINTAKTSARKMIGNNGVFVNILSQEKDEKRDFYHIIFGQGLFFPTYKL